MKTLISLAAFASIACLSTTVLAQQEEDAPQNYVYATYFYCDVAAQTRADEIVESHMRPVYDAAVADGTITGWGWLVHHTGGMWRRLQYHSAPSIDELLAAQEAIGAKLQEADSDAGTEFSRICNAHDDYIWRGVTGSGGNVLVTERGNVGISSYYVCDMSKQTRADELVRTVIGPVYDAHMGAGQLTSWGWSSHVVGGEYRRLGTMTAADWPSLFAARASILGAMPDSELAGELNEICGSHTDYMWELQIESR